MVTDRRPAGTQGCITASTPTQVHRQPALVQASAMRPRVSRSCWAVQLLKHASSHSRREGHRARLLCRPLTSAWPGSELAKARAVAAKVSVMFSRRDPLRKYIDEITDMSSTLGESPTCRFAEVENLFVDAMAASPCTGMPVTAQGDVANVDCAQLPRMPRHQASRLQASPDGSSCPTTKCSQCGLGQA